jgi:hypothetical protein
MVRRALPVLIAALGTVCAGAVGFTEPPSATQLAALGAACVLAAALQWSNAAGPKKSLVRAKMGKHSHTARDVRCSLWLAAAHETISADRRRLFKKAASADYCAELRAQLRSKKRLTCPISAQ